MARPRSALRYLVVVSAVLAMVVQAAVPETSQAIRWGQPVSTGGVHASDVVSGLYPFVAAIGYADPSGAFLWDNQFCDGSLVAPDLVLTTAHCVLGTTPPQLAVVVGLTVTTSAQGQVRSVAEITLDPDYNPDNAANDLAVLRLTQPVVGISPIKVIGVDDIAFTAAGTPLTLARWSDERPGTHSTTPVGSPTQWQHTDVRVVDDTTCAKEWERTGYRDDSVWGLFVCTTPGTFAKGDSGSPLFVATPSGYVQVSLVSGSYASHHKHKTKNTNTEMTLRQEIPDYGPELSAPSSAQFLASVGA